LNKTQNNNTIKYAFITREYIPPYTVFVSMERLEEGKKVNGKKIYPLFGTLSERKERRINVGPICQNLSVQL
jgi:hypothetical protein